MFEINFWRSRRGYLAGERSHYGVPSWWAPRADAVIPVLVCSERLSLLGAKTLLRVRQRNAGYFPWIAADGTVMIHMAAETLPDLPELPAEEITASAWHRHCIEIEQRELIKKLGLWLTVIPDVSGVSRDAWN